MSDPQVAEVRIIIKELQDNPPASRFYADTSVGPDSEHFERDGHRGDTPEAAVEAACAWARSMLSR